MQHIVVIFQSNILDGDPIRMVANLSKDLTMVTLLHLLRLRHIKFKDFYPYAWPLLALSNPKGGGGA